MSQLRQGDVLLIQTSDETKGDVRASKEIRLALGEATGHAHVVRSPRARLHVEDRPEAREENDAVWAHANRILEVSGQRAVELRHEDAAKALTGEHGSIHVAPGRYAVIQQREWDGEDVRDAAD